MSNSCGDGCKGCEQCTPKKTLADAGPPETEKLEHEESENCWCCPTVEEFKNGNKVIIHNGEN